MRVLNFLCLLFLNQLATTLIMKEFWRQDWRLNSVSITQQSAYLFCCSRQQVRGSVWKYCLLFKIRLSLANYVQYSLLKIVGNIRWLECEKKREPSLTCLFIPGTIWQIWSHNHSWNFLCFETNLIFCAIIPSLYF